MSIQAAGSSLRQGLLERLFQRADADRNQSLTIGELASFLPVGEVGTAETIVAYRDQDGDGHLSMAEFSSGILAPETMGSLLTIQEYKQASRAERQADDRQAVDALFARADLDGDGLLSREELTADRTLQLAQALDDGAEVPQHMFAVMAGDGEGGKFAKDDILVGRRASDLLDAVSLEDHPEMAEIMERIRRIRESDVVADAPVKTEPAVPIKDKLTETVHSAELTEMLITRLMQTLERSGNQVHLLDDVV